MFVRRLGLITAAGLILRVLYTVLVSPWPPKGLDDSVFYHLQPVLIAHGRGFIEPVFASIGRTLPSAEHPPLYPVALAGLAKLGATSAMAQRLTGCVFGSVTVLAAGLIGRRLSGERAGLIAAALAAIYPILITADGALMSESLYGMLIALSLLVALRVAEHPTVRRAAGLGALLGLAALTRGEAVVLLVLLAVPLLRRPAGWRAALAGVLATLVVLAPWTIRNAVVFHRFVAISNDSGAVIGGANCPATYYSSFIGAWSFTCLHGTGNEAQQASREQSAGVHYAEHHLGRLPVVILARLERLWGLRVPFDTETGRSHAVQAAGVLMYYLLLIPAALGFVVLRRRGSPTWTLVAPVVTVTLVAAAGYGFLRLREPADICLLVLAGVTLDAALAKQLGPLRHRLAHRRAP